MTRRKKSVPASSGSSSHGWLWSLVFLHLGLSPIFFSAATLEPFDYPKSLLLQLAGAMALGWMAATALQTGAATASRSLLQFGRDPLATGIALFGVSAILSTVFSISPHTSLMGQAESFAGLPTLLSGAILFFGTREACGSWVDGRRLLLAPLIGAVIATSYALVQSLGLDAFTWGRVATLGSARPFGTLGNANALSSFLAAAWPVEVCLSVFHLRQGRRFLAGILGASAVLGAAVIVRSGSRAGWLGLVIGIVGVGIVLRTVGERGTARRLLLTLFAVIAATALALLTPSGREAGRALEARLTGLSGFGSRAFLWRVAGELFLEHPLLGTGVDTFGLAFNPRRTPEFWALEWNTTFVRAHNEGFQLLATQGALGAASAAFILFGLWRAGRVAWRRTVEEERLVLGGLMVAIVCLAPQASLGLLHTAPAILLVTMAALVSVAGREPRSVNEIGPGRTLRLSRTLAVLAPVILLTNASALQGGLAARGATVFAFCIPLITLAGFRLDISDPNTRSGTEPPSDRAVAGPRVAPCLFAAVLSLIGASWLLYPSVAANAAAAAAGRLQSAQPDAALPSIEAAVRLDPSHAPHWSRLGQVAQAAARRLPPAEGGALRLRAVEALTHAASLEPLEGQYRMLRCRATTEQALASELGPAVADAACDDAIERFPANPYFHTAAINAAVQLRELPRARRLAEAALVLYPDLGPLQYQLGFIALEEGRLEEATSRLASAIDADWHGQETSREAARQALAEARRRQAPTR